MNAICLVLDRLHAGYVGAYGNHWIETPALDRLAFDSVVFDQYLIDSPWLESLYRSLWLGQHAMMPHAADEGPTLAERLRRAGVNTTLLTDEPLVADHPLARGFDPVLVLEQPQEAEVAAELDQTHLARCFAEMIQWLDGAKEPFLLWSHLAGLGGPWDAPLEFRRRYADEDDPDPPYTADVPNLLLSEDYDPDQLLGLSQTYAGQVSLLDTCLGALLELFESGPLAENTLLVLLSARGFPMGEHRRVGGYDDALYGELVHVPLLMRFPGGLGSAVRSQALVQPGDLWATLGEWWSLADLPDRPPARSLLPLVRGEAETLRDRIGLTDSRGSDAIRVPAWYLRSDKPELFVKPDDRWEVNDVADRAGSVVEMLQKALLEYQQALLAGRLAQLSPLEEILLTGPE
jgi:arylsulfatase A-like enzyme